ncbi:MAG: Spo0B domain-containing protein [Bacillota bacterium]
MVDFDKLEISAGEIVEALRLQKHDFLNYLQLISGYLQLGNMEKALEYVKTASRDIELSGTIMRLAHHALSIKLLLRVHNAYKSGANIILSTSTDLELLSPDRKLMQFFDQVFSSIEQVCAHRREPGNVQVEFSETGENYCMTITSAHLGEDVFNHFAAKVEQAAAELNNQTFFQDLSEQKVQGFQVCFSKSTRSG